MIRFNWLAIQDDLGFTYNTFHSADGMLILTDVSSSETVDGTTNSVATHNFLLMHACAKQNIQAED